MNLQVQFQQKLGIWLNQQVLHCVSYLFIILLLCFETEHIHLFSASNLSSLIFSRIFLIASNELTVSIPMEVGLLTDLVITYDWLGLGSGRPTFAPTDTDQPPGTYYLTIIAYPTKATGTYYLTITHFPTYSPTSIE